MFEDEYMHPNNNELEFDDYSITSTNYVHFINGMKPSGDKGYHETRVYNQLKEKMSKISFYDSGFNPQMWIRNAMTGRRYNIKVGSLGEDLFFKVRTSLGEGGDPMTLFYTSPAEFEKHFFVKLSVATKEDWEKKRNQYKKPQSSVRKGLVVVK